MAQISKGKMIEDAVRWKLKSYGCELEWDDELDGRYKLDFIVRRFPDLPRDLVPVGVQITEWINNARKYKLFLQMQAKREAFVAKSLYLEFDREVHLHEGGIVSAYAAILEFALDQRHREKKVAKATVFDDLTYRLTFPRQFPRPAASERPPAGRLGGEIVRFLPERGFGFIRCSGHPKEFWFHIKNVSDESVKQGLNGMTSLDPPLDLDIPVSFVNGGQRGSNENPAAEDVRWRDPQKKTEAKSQPQTKEKGRRSDVPSRTH